MELMYTSTRNANEKVTASQAILKGLAEDGGLFVPEQLPTLDKTVDELAGMTYQETAYEVMKKFLTDFTEEELKNCINAAYDSKFDTEEIAPLAKAVIFPRSFVRIVILLSKSPTGMAESTIPVNTTLCDILILLSKYYSSSLYPKFLMRKSLSLQSFFTLTHSFKFTLQSSSLSIS